MEKKLKFYQKWSVWGTTVLGVVTAIEPFFPALQKALPPAWQAPFAMLIIILAATKQKPPGPPSSGAGIAAAGLLILLPACTNPRTPAAEMTRQTCLIKAEFASDQRASKECADAGHKWSECPSRESIMTELKTEQEKCR